MTTDNLHTSRKECNMSHRYMTQTRGSKSRARRRAGALRRLDQRIAKFTEQTHPLERLRAEAERAALIERLGGPKREPAEASR